MTTQRAASRSLTVEAELLITVDGSQARLTSTGRELRLESDAPAALWSAVNKSELPAGLGRISGPRAIGRLADTLAAQGLEFVVVSPSGELVRLGTDQPSRVGRLTTGSRSVRLGSARAIAPVVLALVRQAGADVLDFVRRRLARRK